MPDCSAGNHAQARDYDLDTRVPARAPPPRSQADGPNRRERKERGHVSARSGNDLVKLGIF